MVSQLFYSRCGQKFAPSWTQKHLNIHGDNLGNVVQFMEREHPKKFQNILNSIS
jgi:hypothetical protein